jgi:hypothetical protein
MPKRRLLILNINNAILPDMLLYDFVPCQVEHRLSYARDTYDMASLTVTLDEQRARREFLQVRNCAISPLVLFVRLAATYVPGERAHGS